MAIMIVTHTRAFSRKEVVAMANALKQHAGHPLLLGGEPVEVLVRRLGRRKNPAPDIAIRITANQQRHSADEKHFIEDVVFALACDTLDDWLHPVSVELQEEQVLAVSY